MPDHRVHFTIPYRELGRSDIKFKVYAHETHQRREDDEYLIGTLMVSHGAIEWRSRKKQHTIKLDWHDFDKYMLERKNRR